MQNYYNPYYANLQAQIPQQNFTQTQQQPQRNCFDAFYVSDKAEVNSTSPDPTGNPKYFHNRALNEIYVKQYDGTGAAPVKTYKLVEENIEVKNPFEDYFKNLNEKLDDIKTLLTPDNEKIKEGKKFL